MTDAAGVFVSLFQYAFVRNALATGTFVAIAAGAVGYFLIARGYTFAAHALPNIGFSGAAGAVLAGVNPVYGLMGATLLAAVGIGATAEEHSERDVSIGVIMSFAFGLGLMFLSLYKGFAQRVYGILFGSIVGVTAADTLRAAAVAAGALAAVVLLSRRLLFLVYDVDVARARGVPVRATWTMLLCTAAFVVSVAVQLIGAILVFALLVGPAATASRISHRPFPAIVISALLGVAYMWAGVLLASMLDGWPVGFFVTGIAFAVYLPVRLATSDDGAAAAETAGQSVGS